MRSTIAVLLVSCSTSATPLPAPSEKGGPNAAETPHYTTQPLLIPAGSPPFEPFKEGSAAEPRAIERAAQDRLRAMWDQLTQCVAPRACPASDEGKVRAKAASAFACLPESTLAVALRADAAQEARPGQMVVTLPESQRRFVFSRSTSISNYSEGEASFIARPGTGAVFEVAGCGAWGVVLCVNANRTVKTDTATYENTADRLCLWGRELGGGR